jgi:hypothetical protein
MSLDSQNARLYDSVSETEFGPQCETDAEADALAWHVWRTRGVDARVVDYAELDSALAEIREGRAESMPTHPDRLCYCGSGLPFGPRYRVSQREYRACDRCGSPELDRWTGVDGVSYSRAELTGMRFPARAIEQGLRALCGASS